MAMAEGDAARAGDGGAGTDAVPPEPGAEAPSRGAGLPARLGDGRYRSTSPEMTAAFGELLAELLAEGDVVILEGELGAGKTQLTKGIARGLRASGAVTSPTFTILITHPGEVLDLHHFDLYRIGPDELDDTGILDIAGEEGVAVVEWGRELAPRFAAEWLEISLERDAGDAESGVVPEDDADGTGAEPARIIRIAGEGPRGEELAGRLAARLTG